MKLHVITYQLQLSASNLPETSRNYRYIEKTQSVAIFPKPVLSGRIGLHERPVTSVAKIHADPVHVKVEKIVDPQATTRPPYSIPLLRGS